MKLLTICEAGYRASSKDCPLNNDIWAYKHWYEW